MAMASNPACFDMNLAVQAFQQETKDLICSKARDLGFYACGMARVRPLGEIAERYTAWLDQGMHGSMSYLERNRDMRLDPGLLLPGAKTVICLLHAYYPEKVMPGPYKIARYAYGRDYHKVLKRKMKGLLSLLAERGSGVHRAFTDSAPLLERQWARLAGLGWIGKNSLLITREQGSYFLLSEILTDLELPVDEPIERDYCGGCMQCLMACPTQAIVSPGAIDARRCISYLTIESKEDIPSSFMGKYKEWVFGCDICQEVCPWNRASQPHAEPAFMPAESIYCLPEEQWETMPEETYMQCFKGSPVDRAGLQKLRDNIAFLAQQKRQGSP